MFPTDEMLVQGFFLTTSQSLLNQVNVSNVPPQSVLDRCKIFDKNEHLRGVSPLRASEMGVYLKYLIISTS